jgi:hypothetical protein
MHKRIHDSRALTCMHTHKIHVRTHSHKATNKHTHTHSHSHKATNKHTALQAGEEWSAAATESDARDKAELIMDKV